MPEKNIYGGSSKSYEPDTRFGGNLERANTRRQDPPRSAGDRSNTSSKNFPPDRTYVDPDKGKTLPVLENLGSSNLEKLMAMHDPVGLAYNFFNMLENADLNEGKYSPYVKTTDFGDEIGDKLVYQDAEMGEPGAIIVNGEWKKPTLNKLGDYMMETATTGTYDEEGRFTPTYAFDTTTSDMFTGIPTTLTEENIPAIESSLDELTSSLYGPEPPRWGGSGGDWGGYGNGLAAYYGAGLSQNPKQLGPGESAIPSTELLDYMIRVNKYNPYTKQAMAKDGGLLSLLR